MAGAKGMPTRRVASAIDILTQECDSVVGGVRFTELPIKQIKPYHDHKFRLYSGERLEDMVESIKLHGVLNPVIVLRLDAMHYEMLAGHNRLRAAEMAGLETIPALVKENLTDAEALAYVIETNLMQRSFTDMLPSEQVAVLQLRMDKLTSQGRRNDILCELAFLETGKAEALEGLGTSALLGRRLESREKVGVEYGLSKNSVARLLRINYLTNDFREMVDNNKLPLYAAVDLSYLSLEAQRWVQQVSDELKCPITMRIAKILKGQKNDLTREVVYGIMKDIQDDNKPIRPSHNVRVSKIIYDQYFKTLSDDEIQDVVDKAVHEWYDAGN